MLFYIITKLILKFIPYKILEKILLINYWNCINNVVVVNTRNNNLIISMSRG